MNTLQPPPPFCFDASVLNVTSGNISREWTKWRKTFTIYMKAVKLDKESADVQVNVLLHVIGDQGREIFDQFEGSFTSAELLLKQYDTYFSGQKNLTIERQKFFARNQEECEPIEQFILELNKLVASCEFDKLKDDLVKDRLIYGLRDDTLRERLLREKNLTLVKAIEICKLAELSRAQASFMKNEQLGERHVNELTEQAGHSADIHAVRRAGSRGRRTYQYGAPPPPSPRPQAPRMGASAPPPPPLAGRRRSPVAVTSSQRYGRLMRSDQWNRICDYCGTVHVKFECPAYGRRCLQCNKQNHFARMCRSNRIYTVQEDSADQVCQTRNRYKDSDWVIDLTINNSILSLKLDTGADVNVLPSRFLQKIGISRQNLIPTSTKLLGYSGSQIKVIGKCMLKVKYRSNMYILKFIVAEVDSEPILGRQSCQELNVIKRVLTLSERTEQNILDEYEDVFQGMGCLPGEYKIQLNNNCSPVVHAPRKLPIALRDSVKMKLDELVSQGIIAKVEGPTDWVNSMTVVKKADGDIRICLDPKDLNKAIKREHFKLPTLDEITAKLSGAKFFSTLDAKQSFFQVKLHENSTDLCTFNTAFGRYKFLRMPFGISSASEIFHKRMYEFFDDIEGTILFVDDLLVYGPTKEIHDRRLREVLERCRQINIKLNKSKCKVGLNELKYLGHRISQKGISPDDSHVTAIKNMPKPENTKDLERFLGLITYVGNFVPNLSEKTFILRQLLKKEIEWHWEERHDKCFNDLKMCLTNPPVLQYYSLEKPVTISVDASKHGLGACLMQEGLPVCYASKSLTPTEQRYAQIEKELYACVYACEKFFTYIYGRKDVIIETDHKPLVSIIHKPICEAPARLQRMLLRLQPYSFELVYKPGKYLYVADTLSRAVAPDPEAANARTADESRDHWEMQAQVCAVSVLEQDVLHQLVEHNFAEICVDVLVDFCNERKYKSIFEPNIPMSMLERRSEFEVRAQKSVDIHVSPSFGGGTRPPPTPALVAALADVLYNVGNFASCPVQPCNERGIYRLLFRCASSNNGSVSEILRVRASVYRTLSFAASHKCVRVTLAATKDCLHNLMVTFTPFDEDEIDDDWLSARTHAFWFLGALLAEKAACDCVWNMLRERCSANFFHSLLQCLDSDDTELQNAGMFCLSKLAQSATAKKHPDKTKDETRVEMLDNLKSPFFQEPKSNRSGAGDSRRECQPEFMVEEMCKELMGIYQKLSMDQPIQEEQWSRVCWCLSAVLSASPRGRVYGVHRQMPIILLSSLQTIRDKLSLHGNPEAVKNCSKNPIIRILYWLLTCMDCHMVECAAAKESFAEEHLAISLNRLWLWCMLTDQLREAVVHLMATFTNDCQKAWASMSTCVSGRSLIGEICALTCKEATLTSRPKSDTLLLMCLRILRQTMFHHQCRSIIIKSDALMTVYKLRICDRPANSASAEWARAVEVLARHSEGAAMLLNIRPCGLAPRVRAAILPALAHLARHRAAIRDTQYTSEMLELLSGTLFSGDIAEIVSAARAVWALAANNHRAKLLLRSAGIPAAVQSALQRVQRDRSDAAAQRAAQLLMYTSTVLHTT